MHSYFSSSPSRDMAWFKTVVPGLLSCIPVYKYTCNVYVAKYSCIVTTAIATILYSYYTGIYLYASISWCISVYICYNIQSHTSYFPYKLQPYINVCIYLYTSVHKRHQGNMVLNHATTGDDHPYIMLIIYQQSSASVCLS